MVATVSSKGFGFSVLIREGRGHMREGWDFDSLPVSQRSVVYTQAMKLALNASEALVLAKYCTFFQITVCIQEFQF